MTTTSADVTVDWLDEAAGRDGALVDELTAMINRVYATAESGLWREGATRTTTAEIAELVAARQIAVATIPDGHIVGSVHVHRVSDDASEFGMLAVEPDHRGLGVGGALIDFAERNSRQCRLGAIRLELLVPRTWRHPNKVFLKSWYGRRGYNHIATRSVDNAYPLLAPRLATWCDLEVHEKSLDAGALI
jgi:GNAT superfamily N-acetyltransferase